MKPFLGMDLTENRKNEQMNGEEFLVQTTPASLLEQWQAASKNAVETVNTPTWTKTVMYVLSAAALVTTFIMAYVINQADDKLLVFREQAWVFILFLLELIVYRSLPIIVEKRRKAAGNTEEGAMALSHEKAAKEAILRELQIPENAKEIDVLSMNYKVKNGDVKYAEKTMQLYSHKNLPFYAFTDGDTVYLADMERKYAFDRAAMREIRTVKKTIGLMQWNKETPFNKGEYKAFRMTANNLGTIQVKPYYVLVIDHDGEEWNVQVPCYELPVLEEITGLRAYE